MAQAVAARGHQVGIFTTDQDGTDARLDVPLGVPIKSGDVDVYYFRADILKAWPAASFALGQALKERVQDYDIVHNHSLYLWNGLVGGHYCRKYGVPYLIRPCGALNPVIYHRHRPRKAVFERLFERRNFRNAAAIHFTSQDEMDNAARVMLFRKGLVIPLGLNLEEYAPPFNARALREAFPVLAGKRIVLFLSRLTSVKGLDLLIPAFAQIAKAQSDVHLVLAGPDNEGYGSEVRRWVEANGIADRVLFTGMLQGDLKSAALHDAEMFVLPSYGESFGVAVIEAMASGLPVLISKYVAIWQDVEGAGAGVIVDNEIDKIAVGMRQTLGDVYSAKAMGERAKRLVTQHFSWLHVAEQLELAYLSILKESEM